LYAIVQPQSPNSFFDLARALGDGASRAYLDDSRVAQALLPVPAAQTTVSVSQEDVPALANFNRAFIGDWAFDSTATTQVLDAKGNRIDMPVLTFVRGEDLRTIIVPRGDANAATIASLPRDRFTRRPRGDMPGSCGVAAVGQQGG